MTNSLQSTFDNTAVRVVSDDPVTVVLKDVADALGYKDAHRLKRTIKDKYHVPHEAGDAVGRTQKMTCVTRPGLSQALATLQPRDPDKRERVESFQDWLYEELLEEVYETGSYRTETESTSISPELQAVVQTVAEGTAQLQQEMKETKKEVDDVKRQLQNRELSEDKGERSWDSMKDEVNRLVRAGGGNFADLYNAIYDDIADKTGIDVRRKYSDSSSSTLKSLSYNEMVEAVDSARYLFA